MNRAKARKIMIVTGAVAALGGGTAAVAATQLNNDKAESKAVVDDAAKRLGVPPAKLQDALVQALSARIDEAVKAGRISQQQADAMKARLQAGDLPLGGGGEGFGHRHGGGFGGPISGDAAAKYLGLTAQKLRAALDAGKSLAQVAKDQGKAVDGLKVALTDAAKTRLDAAVKSGQLSQEQETAMLGELSSKLDEELNEVHDGHRGPGGGAGDNDGGQGNDPGGTNVTPWGAGAQGPTANDNA